MPDVKMTMTPPDPTGLDALITLQHAAKLARLSRVALQHAVQSRRLEHTVVMRGRTKVNMTTPRAVQVFLNNRGRVPTPSTVGCTVASDMVGSGEITRRGHTITQRAAGQPRGRSARSEPHPDTRIQD